MNPIETLGVFTPMLAILVTVMGLSWRSRITSDRRTDQERHEFRTETREALQEFRTEAREFRAEVAANREQNRSEAREFRAEVRTNREQDRAEAREELQAFCAETRDNFNTVNRNIEKLTEQLGGHAERVAAVEGYISAVSGARSS